jgi:hypothetical protein
MKVPPIEWEDLVSLGMSSDAIVSGSPSGYTVDPAPPRIVSQLLERLASSPVPEGDRGVYVRHVRNLLLDLTDWTQIADAPLSSLQKAGWATYRQALRDLPSQLTADGPIPWPTIPTP